MNFNKDAEFIGASALLAEQAAGGPARQLVGLDIEWGGIERMFAKHGLGPGVSPKVGRATSVTWGPTIKKMIAFGSVDRAFEKPGTELSIEWTVEGQRGKVKATVSPMPFLDLPRKRS